MNKRIDFKFKIFSLILTAIPIFLLPLTNISYAAGLDVILVMDSSGSMKKTDPQDLRKPAAKLFISLLGATDRASVVSFSDQGYPVVFLTHVKGGKNQSKLFAGVDKISTRGGSTNIYGAIEGAMRVIKRAGKTKNKQVIVLMSDGKMDLGSLDKTSVFTKKLFNELLPDLSDLEIEVHTIAFTGQSDKKLLSDIAEATGGHFNLAKTDNDLHDVYASIFEQNKQPNMLPFLGEKFKIDNSIKEVTIVGSKEAPDVTLSLHSPSGKTLTFANKSKKVKWFVAEKFDLITIAKPEVGQWSIQASSGKNKAYIITDLKLKMTADPRKPDIGEGIMVKAWLENNGQILTKESLLSSLSLKLLVHTPDNQTHVLTMESGAASTGSGVYSSHIALPTSGIHKMEVVVNSDTFNRKRNLQIQVATPTAKQLTKITKMEAAAPKVETTPEVKITKTQPVPAFETVIKGPVAAKKSVQSEKISAITKQSAVKEAQQEVTISKPTLKKEESKPSKKTAKKKAEKNKNSTKKTTKEGKANKESETPKETKKHTSSLMKAIYAFIGINLVLFIIGGGIFFFIKWKRNKAQTSNDESTDADSKIEEQVENIDKAA